MLSLKPAVKREKAPRKATPAEFDAKIAEHQKSAKFKDDLLSGASIEITGVDTTQPLYLKGVNTADPYFTVWLSSIPVATRATDVSGGTLRPSLNLKEQPLVYPLTNEALRHLKSGRLQFNVEVHSLGRITDTLIGYTNGHLNFPDAKSGELSTHELRVHDANDSFAGCIRLGVKCNVDVKAPEAERPNPNNLPAKPVPVEEKTKPAGRTLNPSFTRQKALHKVKEKKVWETKTNELQASALVREDQLSGATVSIVGIDCFGKLPASDGDTSDPYALFWLDEWPIGSLATVAKAKTLTPAWNLRKEPLTFPLTNQALQSLRGGRLALNLEFWDLDVSFDDFLGYSNTYLKYTEAKNGMIEADYQLFDNDSRPAGEVRLYIAVDVESKAPAGEELPSRTAPTRMSTIGDADAGAARGRRSSLAERAAASVKSAHECTIVVFAAPPYRRVKAPDVVKDQKVWTGAKREEHAKLAKDIKDHHLHEKDASLSVIDIRTTSKLPGKGFGGKTSDVYVVVYLPSFSVGSLKTPTVKKTVEPVWDLTPKPLTFPLTNKAVRDWNNGREGEASGLQCHIEVWHCGTFVDDLIGWSNVNLKSGDFNDKNVCAYDLPLMDEKNKPLASGVLRLTIRMDNTPRLAPEVLVTSSDSKTSATIIAAAANSPAFAAVPVPAAAAVDHKSPAPAATMTATDIPTPAATENNTAAAAPAVDVATPLAAAPAADVATPLAAAPAETAAVAATA